MSFGRAKIARVKRPKWKTRSSYDRIAKYYDLLADRSEARPRNAGLAKLAAKEGERVLEIGFGTGHGILALARSVGDSGRVCGIDISDAMLHITRGRVAGAGLSERVELRCGDAASLPFEADFFGAVFMSFTLELFDTPEIPTVLHEGRRVLRGGGRICVIGLSKEGEAGPAVKLYEWAHRNFPDHVDCRPIFVRHALDASGFQILDVTLTSIWGLPVEIVLGRKV